MHLNTIFELVFGIVATILTTVGLKIAYRQRHGQYSTWLLPLTLTDRYVDMLAAIERTRGRDVVQLPIFHPPATTASPEKLHHRRRVFVYEEAYYCVVRDRNRHRTSRRATRNSIGAVDRVHVS